MLAARGANRIAEVDRERMRSMMFAKAVFLCFCSVTCIFMTEDRCKGSVDRIDAKEVKDVIHRPKQHWACEFRLLVSGLLLLLSAVFVFAGMLLDNNRFADWLNQSNFALSVCCLHSFRTQPRRVAFGQTDDWGDMHEP